MLSIEITKKQQLEKEKTKKRFYKSSKIRAQYIPKKFCGPCKKPLLPFCILYLRSNIKKQTKLTNSQSIYSNDKFHQFVRSFESLTRSKQFINEMFGETRQEAWASDFLYEQSHNYCCRQSLFIVTYYSDYQKVLIQMKVLVAFNWMQTIRIFLSLCIFSHLLMLLYCYY